MDESIGSPNSPELLLRPGGSRFAEVPSCRQAWGGLDAGLAGSSGGGVDVLRSGVTSAGGGTWSSTAGTARGRARNMDEKHKAAENTASLPLECNSLRGLDEMHQSCAFWPCLIAN